MMKTNITTITAAVMLTLCAITLAAAPSQKDPMQQRIENYFTPHLKLMAEAAKQQPTTKTFRKIMKPLIKDVHGFAESTLLDRDFVIRQSYYRRHAAAVGYDLKKTESLKIFHDSMLRKAEAQLSSPTKAKLMQPSLLVLRYPVTDDSNKMTAVISLMIKTDTFLKETKLADCPAYKVSCADGGSFSKGRLSKNHKHITAKMPSNEWIIDYDEPKQNKGEKENDK